MANDRVYRPAGFLECFHIARQNLKLDSCVVVAARFVPMTETQRLTKECVYAAVLHALKTHTALSARFLQRKASNVKSVKQDTGVYVYEGLESVNLQKVVHFLDDEKLGLNGEDDVAALIQHEFANPIPSVSESEPEAEKDRPLWRLTITPGNILLFAWHHCIGDGQSGFAVLRTILEGLNDPSVSLLEPEFNPFSVNPKLSEPKVTPPLEELTDLSVSLKTLLSAIAGLIIPSSWTSARKTWTGHPVSSTQGTLNARARLVHIPPERVARILEETRKNGTTLTAVLYLFGVEALSKLILQDPKNKKFKRLSISIPVSLRPLANLPPTVMFETVSAYQFPARISSNSDAEFDWKAAATFSKKLHAAVPKTREVIGTLKYLNGNYAGFFKGKFGKKREGSLEISNVGLFKTQVAGLPSFKGESEPKTSSPGQPAWTISETYFAQDDGIVGAALKMNVVGSPSGSLNICVTWGKDTVDDEFAEAFVGELGAAFERLNAQLKGKAKEKMG